MCCATCIYLLKASMPPAKPWGTLTQRARPTLWLPNPCTACPRSHLIRWQVLQAMQTQLVALFVCFEGALIFVSSMTSLSVSMQEPGCCYLAWRWEGWLRAHLVKTTIAGLCYSRQSLLAALGHDMTLTWCWRNISSDLPELCSQMPEEGRRSCTQRWLWDTSTLF